MTRYASHIAVASAALVAGGLGATAFSNPEPARQASAVPAQTMPPEQVRTVVVTKTIHRVRHVRMHAKPAPAPAAPPAAVAVAPQRPRYVPVAAPRPVVAPATRPIKTHTSGGGGGGGGEHEHEGGGDD